jgi:hypothetical protein
VADLELYPEHKIRPVEMESEEGTRAMLCASRHFAAELLTVESRAHEQPAGACFHILTAFEGSGQVMGVALGAGESLLIPAGIDEYQIEATEPLRLIKAYVPDLTNDVIEPLRRQGVPDETIAQLGGVARHSDLVPLLRDR